VVGPGDPSSLNESQRVEISDVVLTGRKTAAKMALLFRV